MIGTAPSICTVWDRRYGANLPFGSNSVQHGTAVFEGIRSYRGPHGPALLRIDDHLRRLLRSARSMGIRHDYDLARLRRLVFDAVEAGGAPDLYLRPVLFAPEPRLGVDLLRHRFVCAVEVWPVSDDEAGPAGHPGVRLTVSPWRRPPADVFPRGTKATGMYAVSALAGTQASAAGFDDAVQLDPLSGRVAEATVANIFVVRDGRLLTPWREDSLLPGITRDCVLALARAAGVPAHERPVEVSDVYGADEVFLTGTASELVSVAEVDGHRTEPAGAVFTAVAEAFHDAVRGRRFRDFDWLTPVATQSREP